MEQRENTIDLFDFTAQYGTVTEECAAIIITNIVRSCLELFERGIFHRDIKDENILLNPSTLDTSIIDFGCASQAASRDQCFRTFSGTPDYTAPEYFVTGVLDQEKSTVWNIGCVMYILLFGEVPFQTKDHIVQGSLQMVSHFMSFNRRLSCYFQNNEISTQMVDLLNDVLQVYPANRLTFTALVSRLSVFTQ